MLSLRAGRSVLALAVLLGASASGARADGPGFVYRRDEPPVSGPGQPAPREWFGKRVARQLGLCCWSSHNSYGCGNVYSEAAWMFGSCRTFFNEPCLVGPPRPLLEYQTIHTPRSNLPGLDSPRPFNADPAMPPAMPTGCGCQ